MIKKGQHFTNFSVSFSCYLLSQSLRKKYGTVYSLKVGSYKLVFADDVASVKEVLVKKSADYAGRPPFHTFLMTTLGMWIQL